MFQEFFIKPIYNFLILIAKMVPGNDLGVSVLVLVIGIRVLLWPLFDKATKSQVLMKKIQPEMDRIRKVFKQDQLKQAEELMKLYKENHFNPFSSIAILFVQLPVLIALYQVFLKVAGGIDQSLIYPGLVSLVSFDTLLFGIFDLSKSNLILAVFASLVQAATSFLATKGSKDVNSKVLLFISPVMTMVIVSRLPSVMAWYWGLSNIFSIIQQLIIERKIKNESRN